MSSISILSASWEKYDLQKQSCHQDKDIFCPEQLWEFNYLLDTIVKVEPQLDIITVMLSIRKTMRETVAPRPRVKFVQSVVESIKEREIQWVQLMENAKMAS